MAVWDTQPPQGPYSGYNIDNCLGYSDIDEGYFPWTSKCFFLPPASSSYLFTVPTPALACRLSIIGCSEVTPLRSKHSSHSLEKFYYLLEHVAWAFCLTFYRLRIKFFLPTSYRLFTICSSMSLEHSADTVSFFLWTARACRSSHSLECYTDFV